MEPKDILLTQSMLLFKKYGIKSITMDDIAKELGMSKKTIYQFVNNKEDLIDQIFSTFHHHEICAIHQIKCDSTDAIDELLKVAIFISNSLENISPVTVYDLKKYYKKNWEQIETINKEHIYDQVRQNLLRGQEEGLYIADLDLDMICSFHVGLSILIMDESIFPVKKFPKQKLVLELFKHHIRGIVTNRGRAILEHHFNRLNSTNSL